MAFPAAFRQKVIDRNRSGPGDGQPQEERQVRHLLEAQQGLQRIDVAEFRRDDGDDHDHDQRRRRDPGEQPDQQQDAADEFHARDERRQDLGVGDVPAAEILGDLGQRVQLAPAAPQEHPADDDARDQRRQPGEVAGDLPRPVDQYRHKGTHPPGSSQGFAAPRSCPGDWRGRNLDRSHKYLSAGCRRCSRRRRSGLGRRRVGEHLAAGTGDVGVGVLAAGHGGVTALGDDVAAVPAAGLGELGDLVAESLWARKRSAQIGARATTTASCEAEVCAVRAEPPVTQPPQLKPTIMVATAPPAADHRMVEIFFGISIASPFAADRRPSARHAQECVADNQQDQENRKQDGRYEPVVIRTPRQPGRERTYLSAIASLRLRGRWCLDLYALRGGLSTRCAARRWPYPPPLSCHGRLFIWLS